LGVHGALEGEFQQQMIETHTAPVESLEDLDREVRHWRSEAYTAARKLGSSVAAIGTSPLPVTPLPVESVRYAWMHDRYQIVARQHLTCGLHVHVAIESDEEGVGVIDRIRVWLPILLALSANSPFWNGEDTGFASWRSQSFGRWPSNGPTEIFGSAEAYQRMVRDMTMTSVILDEGMVYFDARLSQHYPTVEIRVADVCLRASDSVLLAALCRGLVETAARDWSRSLPAPDVPTTMVRLATWQAAREGTTGRLLDPLTSRPRPAWDVVDQLVEHIHPALSESGDVELVKEGLERIRTRGNGAQLQARTMERTGQLIDVVAQAVRVTAGQEEED
ncbi:MAG: glutamate--cysteine ligase, partial [Dietzia sp.]|nr:glutamate--cysteine ligase [Dietzia sp.]